MARGFKDPKGLEKFANRNIGLMSDMVSRQAPGPLISEVPPDPSKEIAAMPLPLAAVPSVG